MFKCGDKCTGIHAAEARLVREKICYDNAKKENDCRGMKTAAQKVRDTQMYIKLMSDWPPAVNLAIKPALRVAKLQPPERMGAIMNQIQRVQETGINPINGLPLGVMGVTGTIIEYLIAKHDKKPFIRTKHISLTRDNLNAITYLMKLCGSNQKAAQFLRSLVATA